MTTARREKRKKLWELLGYARSEERVALEAALDAYDTAEDKSQALKDLRVLSRNWLATLPRPR